ncbi:MAG: T9SS type A sorting domain-containing protein [bacterium]
MDDFTGVDWTMSPWNPAYRLYDDYFQTFSGKLNGEEFDEEVCWQGPLLDISTAGGVSFSVDLSWQNFDAEDYIDLAYSIDEGAFVSLPNVVGGGTHTIQYASGSYYNGSLTVSQGGLSGNTLRFKVCIYTSDTLEYTTIDNVSVPQSGVSIACEGDVTLSSQAEVDAFDCTLITGNLTINGGDINDLSPLSSLTSVGGTLEIISNYSLFSLDGLSSLTLVGGDLNIALNTDLLSLNGLSSLSSVGGDLEINNNLDLNNLNGLSSLSSVGGDLIVFNNSSLTTLDGLSSLSSVGGDVTITSNSSLSSLDGLALLTSVGEYITILSNPAITNLDGLALLTSVGTGISITSNSSLSNLDGLAALTSVGGDFYIVNNTVLTEYCGLFNLLNSGGLTGSFATQANQVNPSQQDIIDEGPCCDIQINSVTVSDEGCPGANDGYISINASCTTCTSIEYSIDGTNFQSGNSFSNVSPGPYTVYVRDVGGNGCVVSDNSTYINPGSDNESPVVSCENIEVCLEPGLNVMITPQDVLTSVTDNCGVDENSFDVFPNNFSATGTFNVTVYASDVNGNQGSCNATVTVNLESTAPTTVTADINNICTGQTVSLTASGGVSGTGADIVWYDGPNGTGNMLGTGSDISVTPSTTTTYYARREGVCNNTEDAILTITVGDNTAPELTVISDPITLWPPDHNYVTINMEQLFESVSDNCSSLSINDVYIVSASSDEPEDGDNDGATLNDIVVIGENCNSVQLRAERDGEGNGRVYTIHLAVDDGNGNTGTAEAYVHVPVNKNGSAIDDGVTYEVECNKSAFASFAGDEIQLKNYPNPFNGSTTIAFTLTETENATLKVYDTFGKEVATLFNGMAGSAQQYTFEFKGENLPKGIYVYHLQSGTNVSVVKKMILMK